MANIYDDIKKHDDLLILHQRTIDCSDAWMAKYGHIKFEEWDVRFRLIEDRLKAIEDWMPTLEPRFDHLQTQINDNFVTLKE